MAELKIRCKILAYVTCCLMVTGCATSANMRQNTTQPGWYGITTGWNNWSDVNGEVGHRLYVSNPRGRCEPGGGWTASASIVSGVLPPGLSLNDAPWAITGIPLERGHWIVRMKLYNISCNNQYFNDFEQELSFHITGSGKVVQ